MKDIRQLGCFAAPVFLMIVGGLLYIRFRDTSLLLFSWFEKCSINYEFIKSNISNIKIWKPIENFTIYSAPNGFWLLSGILTIYNIWKKNLKNVFIYSSIITICAIAYEFGQLVGIASGTFDFNDLVAIVMFYAIGMIFVFTRSHNEEC
jgi:hypothetical protein